MKKNILAVLFGAVLSLVTVVAADNILRLASVGKLSWKNPQNKRRQVFDEEISKQIALAVKDQKIFSWQPTLPYKEATALEHEGVDYSEKGNLPCLVCGKPTNVVIHSIAKTKISKKIIYDVHFSFDAFGRRITPSRPHAQYNIVMLGDSFTLGEGLNDDQTAAYQLAQMRPEAQVYNLGASGYGPNDIYYELTHPEESARLNGIENRRSIIFYSFMGHHMERLLCRSSCLKEENNWMQQKPYYQLVGKSDELHLNGTYDKRYVTNFFYHLFNMFYFVQINDLHLPPYYTRANYRLFAEIVSQIQKKSLEMFNGADFFFVLSPGIFSGVVGSNIGRAVAKKGIHVLDYTNLNIKEIAQQKAQIPMDGHPSPISDYVFAYLFNRDLPTAEAVLGKK